MKRIFVLLSVLVAWLSEAAANRPNILLAISDDQSWLHTSIAGCRAVQTPAFDRVATSGLLFKNCIAGSPGCSPSRAALLTGLHHWQLEQAGTHASAFPAKYVAYPDLLERAGYFVGYTGKAWGPGNWKISGRPRNPAGPAFSQKTAKPPFKGISNNDYAGNFADFLAARPKDQPFCFWYGATEPHRGYEKGAGLKAGKKLSEVEVPPFLPDTPEIRGDLLDYLVEIEWFDTHLGRMLETLEKAGELANTLVIVTGDNGMPFPRAKANMYEYGIHEPLAISWLARAKGGRTIEDPVGFVDLTATILEAAGVKHPAAVGDPLHPVGKSLMNILTSTEQGTVDPARTMVFSGRERHSSSRYQNLGYPTRALRTADYLYIRNCAPERWPAGDPQTLGKDGKPNPMHGAYHDIDGCPTLDFLVANREADGVKKFFHLAVDKRPAEELFDIKKDPSCLNNLAGSGAHAGELKRLREAMEKCLKTTGDPRVGDNPGIWETYPRYSPIRDFPPSP